MYYVVRHGRQLDVTDHPDFYHLDQARNAAERLKAKDGHQYHVLKVETVWTTQTLADLMAEGINPRAVMPVAEVAQ